MSASGEGTAFDSSFDGVLICDDRARLEDFDAEIEAEAVGYADIGPSEEKADQGQAAADLLGARLLESDDRARALDAVGGQGAVLGQGRRPG